MLLVFPGLAPGQPAPIFVLNSLDADISVIDPVSWKEVKRLPTGKEPHHLYMTPDESSIIVANALADSLTFVDPRTATIQKTVRGIVDPYQLRFSPDMKWLVTAGNRLQHVDLYRWDGKELSLVKRIPSGKTPSHIFIDSKSTVAYVTMQDSDELVAIDLEQQRIRWRVRTGPMPADVFGTPDGRKVLVGLTGSDKVQIFDVSYIRVPRSVGFIRTGAGAHAFRAAGDGQHVFVSNRVANTISKIDLETFKVVESYPAPGGPDCMEVLAGGRYLLATARWARKLIVIDTKTGQLAREVSVGRSPHGVWTIDHTPRF
ncbi:MAG TPA: YncE family protein [Ramlibacter sp.]|nr:YncE family protein [Ramlibacter sp.]HET8747642.1 YncE family protein [Ramlibacter sp.]